MAYARSLVCNIPWLPITHFECNSAAAATNATVTNPEILLSVMGNWAYVHICTYNDSFKRSWANSYKLQTATTL